VQRFEQAAKMMKTVARGGTPNIPGMGPVPGMGRPGASAKRGKKGKSKGVSRSGNPAKRAAENAGLVAPSAPTGSGFGLGGQKAPSEADLAEIQKLFGKG
jgi:signal recognition particle subunit SRP54